VSTAAVRDADAVHVAQPCGKRAFAWFTYYKNKNVCFLLDIKQRATTNIYPVHAAFNSDLSLGTVLHGTVVQHGGYRCFFVDNLFHLKGRAVDCSYAEKLKAIERVLKESLDNQLYLPSQVLFYLCAYSYTPTAFQVPYKLFCIKSVSTKSSKIVNYADEFKTFNVRKTAVCDTYELLDDFGKVEAIAGVNTYESSVALKRIFGGVVRSLDSIEESDDETDFEPVYESERRMVCRWHPLHKHWTPVYDWHAPPLKVGKMASSSDSYNSYSSSSS